MMFITYSEAANELFGVIDDATLFYIQKEKTFFDDLAILLRRKHSRKSKKVALSFPI